MNSNIIFFILCILICLIFINTVWVRNNTERHPDTFKFIGLIFLILIIYIVISGFNSLFYKKPTPKQKKQTEQDMFDFFSNNY